MFKLALVLIAFWALVIWRISDANFKKMFAFGVGVNLGILIFGITVFVRTLP